MPEQSSEDSKLDKWEKENVGEFFGHTLVLCEGKADAAFFRALLDFYELDGFQVGFPTRNTADGKFGKDGFGSYISGSRPRRGFDQLRNIVIVRDCDDDANASFAEVRAQIAAAGGFAVPDGPHDTADGTPFMTVLMVPWLGEKGNLETLLLRGIKDGLEKSDCFEPFFRYADFDEFSLGVSSKKKLAVIIAACNHKNPTCTTTHIWTKENRLGNPLAIDHSAFRPILEFLRRFAE